MDERRSADVRVPTRSNGAITLRQSPHARQEENASAQARPNEASVGDTYLRLPDNLALRNNRRSRRIATNKNRTTSATAAAGASNARKDIRSAPPSSAVAMTGFPRPPVKTVEWALSIPVNPCVRPAMPPPAITAAVHFTIGATSVMTAADTIVPAINAAGVAKASSRLSTTGT